MTSLLDKPKPGQFKAFCRLASTVWEEPPIELAVAWREILARPIPYGDQAAVQLYREEKARLEAALAPWPYDNKQRSHGRWRRCDLEFADRSAFEQHMREHHAGGVYRWDAGGLAPTARTVRNYTARMPIPVKLWKGPRLPDDGKPWSDEDRTEACTCGLVLELGTSEASRQFVREHRELCTGQAVAS